MLAKAKLYQEQHTDRSSRPVYHFSAPVGWLNDPNGFSLYRDQIHLFYQYYPFGTYWSYMHWGHAVSDDFTFWDDLPVALAPDQHYDSAGCFSGSAVEVDGKQILLYTGVAGGIGPDGLPHGPQQQCLAVGNGTEFTKSPANPVISTEQLPDGFLPQDFRDPKVWKDGSIYRMVVAAAKPDGLGCLLIFESPDLETWQLRGTLLENDGQWGTMWECPDVFALDGSDVALVSLIRMAPGHTGFHPGNPVIAYIGKVGWDDLHFSVDRIQQVDEGTDFYAPQTLLMPDGRRILIAWMQDGYNRMAPPEQNWQGMMTYPRELTVADGFLVQQPVREIADHYVAAHRTENFSFSGQAQIPGLHGRSLDILLTLSEMRGSFFRLELASGAVTLTWSPEAQTLTFDRSSADSRSDRLPVQTFRTREDLAGRPLRLLLDRNSLEVFLDGGRQTFTGIYYAPDDADSITFSTDGEVRLDLAAHTVGRKQAPAAASA